MFIISIIHEIERYQQAYFTVIVSAESTRRYLEVEYKLIPGYAARESRDRPGPADRLPKQKIFYLYYYNDHSHIP